jgi:O-antigen ligase
VWKPSWRRLFALILLELTALTGAFLLMPETVTRFSTDFIAGATNFKTSGWLHTINGGLVIAKDNLLTGIGPGNFRVLSHELLEGIPYTRPDNHPHNYYSQLLCETGVIGFLLGIVFLWTMVWACFKESLRSNNVFIATAWITPFALFWPIATTADFFGQWNNTFMWSALAIAVTSVRWHDKTYIKPHYHQP